MSRDCNHPLETRCACEGQRGLPALGCLTSCSQPRLPLGPGQLSEGPWFSLSPQILPLFSESEGWGAGAVPDSGAAWLGSGAGWGEEPGAMSQCPEGCCCVWSWQAAGKVHASLAPNQTRGLPTLRTCLGDQAGSGQPGWDPVWKVGLINGRRTH